MNGNHMKYMLLASGGLLGVLLASGVSLQSALFLALVLACPLMMVFMLGGGAGHDHQQESYRRDDVDQDTDPAFGHRHDS